MHYFVFFLFLANILRERERERELVALPFSLRMSCYCICYMLFLHVPWVGLKCVIVVFPDYTHLLFAQASGI